MNKLGTGRGYEADEQIKEQEGSIRAHVLYFVAEYKRRGVAVPTELSQALGIV
jgi:hypothetical protein